MMNQQPVSTRHRQRNKSAYTRCTEKNKTSSIIITHDMTCAKTTADRILMLNEGVIIAEGSYEELEKSEDKWIRSFFIKYYLCKRNLS